MGSPEGIEVQDFGDVENKKKDLQSKIDAANRGIALAKSLNDESRIKDLKDKLLGFTLTLADIEMAEKGNDASERMKMEDPYDFAHEGKQRIGPTEFRPNA